MRKKRIIRGRTLARRASEGVATCYPRLRVGLVSRTLRRNSRGARIIRAKACLAESGNATEGVPYSGNR
jgi:hypothetical protein